MKTTTNSIIESATKVCSRKGWTRARSRLDEITFAPHYSERGYSTDKPAGILFGNWNATKPYQGATKQQENESAYFLAVCKRLEKLAELEWSDEWTTCSECGGAVRTSGDCYGWQRAYVELDGEIICRDCAPKHAEEILTHFENESGKCLTADLGIKPGEHGYVKLPQEFENGLYGGQDADPGKIAEALRSRGVSRFLFTLDSVGQFDARFSVWIHSDESDLMPEELSHDESACALDPAEGLKRALQSIPVGKPE